jgi:hypothetical protein
MNSLIEIRGFEVTLASHFTIIGFNASYEKIVSRIVFSSVVRPPAVNFMGNDLMRGISKMKKNEFSGYLKKFSSF